MKNLIGKNVLITTNNWFIGKDGRQYKAVWGALKQIHTTQETLGFTPSRQNTNWFIEVGNMVIAGCQVLYMDACEKPNTDKAPDWSADAANGSIEYLRPSMIYISE